MRLPSLSAHRLLALFMTAVLFVFVGLALAPAGSISDGQSSSEPASQLDLENLAGKGKSVLSAADHRKAGDQEKYLLQGVTRSPQKDLDEIRGNSRPIQVPEPSTAILMLLGLLGLGTIGSRVEPDREVRRTAKQSGRA